MVKPARNLRPAAGRGPPRGCTNLKLRQLTRRVSQHYDRIVGAAGLKTTQYSLLATSSGSARSRPATSPGRWRWTPRP
jgi:hypothetical protein